MTIYGWDMSHYDAVPTGAALVSEGISFATHKAGGDANDAELGAWWSSVKAVRGQVLLGAYWVLRPDLQASAPAAADAFLARLDDQCPGWRDGPFLLQLDCERWNGDPATQPGASYIEAFADRLTGRVPKLRPVVYASQGQYGDTLSGINYPLWNARYPVSTAGYASVVYAAAGGDTGKGWANYSGRVPVIWQFTSSAKIAGQSTCDANAYRGTLAELTKLVAPGWEVDLVANLSVDDVKAIWKTDDVLGAPSGDANATSNPYWTADAYLRNTYGEAKNAHTMGDRNAAAIADVATKVDALTASVAALAAKLDGTAPQS